MAATHTIKRCLSHRPFLTRLSKPCPPLPLPSSKFYPLRIRQSSTISQTTPEAGRSSNPSRMIRPLIPPPQENSGPLLARQPNRALPDLKKSHTFLKTLPLYALVIILSSLAIFNYQKSSSSTVSSILYALRVNPTARDVLGDEIYFASKVPWISGELNQLHGHIDISFWVKGTKGQAKTKFVSVRKQRNGFFETLEWSLHTEDGTVIQLLDQDPGADPMKQS